MFTDRIVVRLVAGKGGNGIVAWRREKYIPKGGPTGGNGGCGGSIVLRADPQVPCLESLRHHRVVRAQNGQVGGPDRRRGKSGKDRIVKLPCGTLVKDAQSGEVLRDLTKAGEECTICRGGAGGRGNESFKSPTHQAPNRWTPGKTGETREIEFELKLIADVGLVGFPNAGKSTFIHAVAKCPVKIAPYPFTTLRPNIGYIEFPDYSRLLIADIPGIIGGAHENRGLGLEFLRHIERTRILVYILDASGIDGRTPLDDYHILRKELSAYDPLLLDRPSLVLLNKVDTEESREHIAAFRQALSFPEDVLHEVSAQEGTELNAVVRALLGCNTASLNGQEHEIYGAREQRDRGTCRPVEVVTEHDSRG